MQIRGTWKFQNGEVSVETDEEDKQKEQEFIRKLKLGMMEKNRFFG